MKTFQEQLDVILLADTLHAKKCTKNHAPLNYLGENYCDFYVNNHNKNLVLGQKVKQTQAKQKYIQQSKDILTLCENMHMEQIIKIVNTILE